MIVEVVVLCGAAAVVSVAAVTIAGLRFARDLLKEEAPPTQKFYEKLSVRPNVGELRTCPYCGQSNREHVLLTQEWINWREGDVMRHKPPRTPQDLSRTQIDGKAYYGPTKPLARVDLSDGPMLFQACCSCGSEWLVKPT